MISEELLAHNCFKTSNNAYEGGQCLFYKLEDEERNEADKKATTT